MSVQISILIILFISLPISRISNKYVNPSRNMIIFPRTNHY